MVHSKFRLWGLIAITVSILLLLFILCFISFLIYNVSSYKFVVKPGSIKPYQAVLFVLFFLLLFVAALRSVYLSAMIITIDSDFKTIVFKRVLTGVSKSYSFNDFDCYLDTIASNRKAGETYRVIYLINDKKINKAITGFYYSNIEEMETAITGIKYWGFQEKYSFLARQMLLNKNVIS